MPWGLGLRYLKATTGFISTSWYCGGNKVWKCSSVNYSNNRNPVDQFTLTLNLLSECRLNRTIETLRLTKQNRLDVYGYNVVMLKLVNTRWKPQTTSCLCVKLNGYRVIDHCCNWDRDIMRWNPNILYKLTTDSRWYGSTLQKGVEFVEEIAVEVLTSGIIWEHGKNHGTFYQ